MDACGGAPAGPKTDYERLSLIIARSRQSATLLACYFRMDRWDRRWAGVCAMDKQTKAGIHRAASVTVVMMAVAGLAACSPDGVMQEVSAAASRGDAVAESQRPPAAPAREPSTLGPASERAFDEYRAPRYPDFKAFFYSPGTDRWGRAWGYHRPEQAILLAQGGCEGQAGAGCRIYAIGDRIVAGLAPPELRAAVAAYSQAVLSRRERLTPGMRRLTGDEIKSVLSGVVAEVTSVNGSRATARFFADGRISVTQLPPGIPGRNEDTGMWWIENGMFCRRFSHWYDGIPECQWIIKEGETFKIFDESLVLVSSFVITGNRSDHRTQ